MPPILALLLCLAFIAWLFYMDYQRRERLSFALWIPLLWIFILGSRPVSLWFGVGPAVDSSIDLAEGSPLDRLVFLILIMAGIAVLAMRHLNWADLIHENKWLCIFFLYLGLSVFWSDYPFVSFKRWIKDFGNVIMVLVVLSEEYPGEAIEALFARCTYLLIPLSVLVLKYYPSISRFYDIWSNQPVFTGINVDKNALGMTLFVCGVSLAWMWGELWNARDEGKNKTVLFGFSILMIMIIWLLDMAHSATGIVCTVLGVGTLLAMRLPFLRDNAQRLGSYSLALVLLVALFYVVFDFGEVFQVLGRDQTLTGRTEIWRAVLKEDVNPLIGAGHYSFWLSPDRVERLSEGYYNKLNEAHNGFLELYLNSGLIGVFLLTVVLGSATGRIKRQIATGSTRYGTLRLALVLGTVVYSLTEAVFRFGFIFFAFLVVIAEWPLGAESFGESEQKEQNPLIAT